MQKIKPMKHKQVLNWFKRFYDDNGDDDYTDDDIVMIFVFDLKVAVILVFFLFR